MHHPKKYKNSEFYYIHHLLDLYIYASIRQVNHTLIRSNFVTDLYMCGHAEPQRQRQAGRQHLIMHSAPLSSLYSLHLALVLLSAFSSHARPCVKDEAMSQGQASHHMHAPILLACQPLSPCVLSCVYMHVHFSLSLSL